MTDIKLTAQEAYPAFETLVAEARRDVCISMRIFDADTPLFAEQARGKTWADLIASKLAEGVIFDITLSDFDPIARPALHRYAWECLEKLKGAASLTPDHMRARVHMHPAQAGFFQRLLFSWISRRHLHRECARLNALDEPKRDRQLANMPEFAKLTQRTDEGHIAPKRFTIPPLHLATHHQKMAVIDGEALYIGGLDLNARRYDTKAHDRPAKQTWHDTQVIVRGPVVKAARDHLRAFRDQTTPGTVPSAPGLLRTLSQSRGPATLRLSPKTAVSDLEQAHLDLIDRANRFIYIETQFLRSSRIVSRLCAASERGVDLIVILPAAPEEAAFDSDVGLDTRFGEGLQARSLQRLTRAFGDRLFVGSPVQHKTKVSGRDTLERAPIIYVHSKVIVADADKAIVSSANLNGRSMRWDTETGVTLTGQDAQALFDRCSAHWFCDAAPRDVHLAQTWRSAALDNARKAPPARSHFIVPHDPEPAQRSGQTVPGLPEEMV